MAGSQNDDLFAYGEGAGGSNTGTASGFAVQGQNPAGFQPGYVGGDAGAWHQEQDEQGNWHNVVDRQSGAQQDVNNFNQRAAGANDRSAYHPDYGGFDTAMHGFEYGQGQSRTALGLERSAAEGREPSAATIAGQNAINQSVNAELGASASARGGPLAQAAAVRNAQRGSAVMRQNAIQALAANRANEMQQARGQYAGTSLGYENAQLGRGQVELGRTGQQQQGEQFQRSLNQNQEQYYIDKAQQTKQAQLAADFAREGQQFQESSSGRDQDRADRAQSWNQSMQAVQAGTNIYGAGAGNPPTQPSDARTKNPIQPGADHRSGDIVRENPYGHDTIDLDANENDFDADEYDRNEKRRASAKTDIFHGDPYDHETNAMLDDRARQNGAPSAHWLEEFRGQSAAYPQQPVASRKVPAHDYVQGEFSDWKNDVPGANDTYSDANTKIVASPPVKIRNPISFERDTPSVPGTVAGNADEKELRRKNGGSTMVYSDENAKRQAYEAGVLEGMHSQKVGDSPHAMRPASSASPLGKTTDVQRDRKAPVSTINREVQQGIPAVPAGPLSAGQEAVSIGAGLGAEEGAERERGQTLPNAALQSPPHGPPPRNTLDPERPPAATRHQLHDYSDDRTKEDAARRMHSVEYTYKDEYNPPDQKHGEVNYGPVAQELEKNPLTATAVKKDPRGVRMVDMHKMVKAEAGVISHLQEQIDDLRGGRRARRL